MALRALACTLLLLPALAIALPAAGSTACPDAAITSPAPNQLVVQVGFVPFQLHHCALLSFTADLKDANGNVVSTTPPMGPFCGTHDDVNAAFVSFSPPPPHIGQATIEVTAFDCAGNPIPVPKVTFNLVLL